MQRLEEFIKENYGSQYRFAAHINKSRAYVSQLIKDGCMVSNDALYIKKDRDFIVDDGVLYIRRGDEL